MITTQIHKLQAQRGAPIGVAAFVFARGGGGVAHSAGLSWADAFGLRNLTDNAFDLGRGGAL